MSSNAVESAIDCAVIDDRAQLRRIDITDVQRWKKIADVVFNHLSINDPNALADWIANLRRDQAQRAEEDESEGWKR